MVSFDSTKECNMSAIDPTGATPSSSQNFSTGEGEVPPQSTQANSNLLNSSSLLQATQTTTNDFSTLVQAFNQLPEGEISIFEYFASVAEPERELIALARLIDLLNSGLRRSFHESGVSQFKSLLSDYSKLNNQSQSDSANIKFPSLDDANEDFNDHTLPEFQSAQTDFNDTTNPIVSSDPWNTYNNAVDQFNYDLSHGVSYEEAAKKYNKAVDAYNSKVKSYNNAVKDYNNAVQKYNDDLADLQEQIDDANKTISLINVLRGITGQPLLQSIPSVSDSALQKYPTLSEISTIDTSTPGASPSYISSPPVSPIAPSIVDADTVPHDLSSLGLPQYIQSWFPSVTSAVSFLKSAKEQQDTQDEIDPISLALILLQRGKLNTQNLPGFIRDIGSSSSASSSGALAQIVLGLGNSNLESMLSSTLLTTVLKEAQIDTNVFLTRKLATTLIGLLTQLVMREVLLGILPSTSRLLEANLKLDVESLAANISSGLSSVNLLLNLISSGDLNQTIIDVMSKLDDLKDITPRHLALLQQSAALQIALLSLAVLGQTSNIQSTAQQAGFFALLSGISPDLLTTSSVELFKTIFGTQSSLQQGVELVQSAPPQTNAAIQDELKSLFTQELIKAGIDSANAEKIAESLVTEGFNAISHQEDVTTAFQSNLSTNTNLSDTEAQKTANELVNALLVSLLIAQFGNQAATTFGQQASPLFSNTSDQIQQIVLGNTPFSDEVKRQIDRNLAIIQDISHTLSKTNNQKIVENAIESFTNLQAEVIHPNIFLQELVDPSRTFMGIMYNGTKKGFERGATDIAV